MNTANETPEAQGWHKSPDPDAPTPTVNQPPGVSSMSVPMRGRKRRAETESKALTTLSKAATMLAEAKTIQEILHVRNLAQRAADFAKAAKMGLGASNSAKRIELDARRKAGETIRVMKERGELREGKPKLSHAGIVSSLDDLGLTLNESSRYQAEATIPEEKYQAWVVETCDGGEELSAAGLRTLCREQKESRRQSEREADAARVAGLTTVADLLAGGAVFSCIVLDPPWDWGDEGDCDQLGRARPTYVTMPIEEVQNLPIGQLSAQDCHLYLWITNRSLPKGFGLLEAWGFRYITLLTWLKPHFGMGNYFRGQTEHVLFGVKGSLPLLRKDAGTWFSADRGPDGHSSKPEEFYELVESCSPIRAWNSSPDDSEKGGIAVSEVRCFETDLKASHDPHCAARIKANLRARFHAIDVRGPCDGEVDRAGTDYWVGHRHT